MASPSKTIKVGNISAAIWDGTYTDPQTKQTTPTQSFTIKKQKFNKETKQWEDSPFLNKTDLKDIGIVLRMIEVDLYKMDSPDVGF